MPVEVRSNQPPRRQPPLMPIQIPMAVDRIVLTPNNSTVGQTRLPITSHTGRENCADRKSVENGFLM